jgi:hypothetical protein
MTAAGGGSSTQYVFKKAPDPTFEQSLKAKHDRDSAEQYVTIETFLLGSVSGEWRQRN